MASTPYYSQHAAYATMRGAPPPLYYAPPPIVRALGWGAANGGAPNLDKLRKEAFAGARAQGDDEDWPPTAPIDIRNTTAVATTNGDVAVRVSRGKGIDIHELLKKEAFASETAECDNHFEKNRPCPDAVYGVSDQYMVLDSFEKVETSNPAAGEYKFNFAVQNVTQNQTIGVRDIIDTVIHIQIGSFFIPIAYPYQYALNPPTSGAPLSSGVPGLFQNGPDLSGATFQNPLSGPLTQIPYGGRMTLELREIGLQSISDRGGVRHHFEFDAIPVFAAAGSLNTEIAEPIIGPAFAPPPLIGMRLVPMLHADTYIFTEPIKDIQGLSLVFRTPDLPVQFPPDIVYGSQAYTDSTTWPGIAFTIPAAPQGSAPLIALNDRIFITGLTTNNAVIDNYINRVQGQVVGTNSGETYVTLNPSVDISPLVPVAPAPGIQIPITSSTRINIFIAKNRIRIPMKFRRIVQRLTNYLNP